MAEYNKEEVAVAIIDMSTSTLHIMSVPTLFDSQETEEFLEENGFKMTNCSWGEFDGEINDER
jgi:hypothetical protein